MSTFSIPLFLIILLIIVIFLVYFLILTCIARPRPSRIPIKGRHVFITGGSSGIGLAIARVAAHEGAHVSILARDLHRLEEARDSIRLATGVEVGIYSVDVRDAKAVSLAIKEAGSIDVLICSQGVFTPQELEKQELDEIRLIVDVNLMGTIHLIKAALPDMKRKARETGLPGSVAIVSAQAGQVGVYGYAAYSASKFALKGLSESLQHELIANNIFVSLIYPADTDTPGFIEELRRRPEITNLLVAHSAGMKAEDVARKALNGIKAGRFTIPCNFEGAMLAIATAGLSPQSSALTAFLEVSTASIMRFVALCFQWNWFSAIEKWHAKNSIRQH